jgi:hypothetical protein
MTHFSKLRYPAAYVIEIGHFDNNNRGLFKRHFFNLMEVVKLPH